MLKLPYRNISISLRELKSLQSISRPYIQPRSQPFSTTPRSQHSTMPPKEKYTDPALRDEIKEEIKAGDKGGKPGQWSARKAQFMASEYKKRGGGYNEPKDASQQHLTEWTEEEWVTKEGEGKARRADGVEKRYVR